MRRTLSGFVLLLTFAALAFAAEPQRSQGVSIHMLPKRVARISGKPWGFFVDYSPKLKAEAAQAVIQTSEGLLAYVLKQDAAVQANGVWIVMTNPDAYSDEEMTLLDEVKSLCRREKIPLFICRASELPHGWKRYDD